MNPLCPANNEILPGREGSSYSLQRANEPILDQSCILLSESTGKLRSESKREEEREARGEEVTVNRKCKTWCKCKAW